MNPRLLAIVICFAGCAAPAWAQEKGFQDPLGTLKNHPFSDKPTSILGDGNSNPPAPPVPPPVLPIDPNAPPPPPPPSPTPDGGLFPLPPKHWKGSGDVGLNGTAGNSETLNFRTSWNVRRKVENNLFVTDFVYLYASQHTKVTTNQALFNARDEILFSGSPWTIFAATQIEYDELIAFRFRVGNYVGAGYTVVDDEIMTLKLRAGVGAVRNFGTGTTPSDWGPEMVLGYDYRFKLTERSAFVSMFDFYDRLDDCSIYRIRARASYELLIDPATKMILRLGVQDRYDSDSGTASHNDFTYFATLGFKF